ncbi:MAG: D-alanine--D-alanine ligase family protein [Gemmatimonadaceae bacterium]
MTRIGFAYNQKPGEEGALPQAAAETPHSDEEPPSKRRDIPSRNSDSPAAPIPAHAGADPATPPLDEHAEWDTPETIDAVAAALSQLGDVIRLEADHDFPARLRAERPDIVFNIAEGLTGMNRESRVPAICEFFSVPYSGSDPFTLSLCLHKARTKEVLSYNRIPTAAFALVRSPHEIAFLRARLDFPLFAKPVHEGSSKGITERSFCRDAGELEEQVTFLLERYDEPVLVEQFLPGAEFTCAVLGNGPAARVLPIVEMDFETLPAGALPIYGFEAKWLWDSRDRPLEIFRCPARVNASLRQSIESTALRAYDVLGCRDWARVDIRLDAHGTPNIVEVNPLPGILPDAKDNSCLPKAARAAGIGYDALIQSCLMMAAERQGVPLPELPAGARRVAAG